MKNRYICSDMETFPNVFSLDLKDPVTNQRWVFEISWLKNQAREMIDFLTTLRQEDYRMIGFNSMGFDYPVLHFILKNQDRLTPLLIYQKAQSIIDTAFNNRFGNIVWESDHLIPQIDLFKVHHFDNRAKMTSLKVIEFNMRMESVEELPFPPGTLLKADQIDTLLAYGSHDVDATTLFFIESLPAIEFRETLSEKYGQNMMNFNDTKIGKHYLITKLEEQMPGCCYDTSSGKRKMRQTKRDVIHFRDVIFPYVHFDHPEFQRVHNWFLTNSITNTKGDFKIDCTIRGFRFDFGTGGIHGSIDSQIVRSDEDWIIEDIDVSSYYPNLGIKNRVYPEHLSERFCDIYEEIYFERKQHKKGTPENAALKLALNGTYGDSNNEYSPLYDPKYTMTITINGQLLLCMLAEKLMACDYLTMIQINTDGMTIKYPRRLQEWVHSVCQWWEQVTKLELEYAEYRNMYIRDVNSYIGEYMDGKLKRKGAYSWVFDPKKGINVGMGDLEWHKDHSCRIVPMAAEAALVRGEDIRTFIERHTDIFDFMLRIKVPGGSALVAVDYDGYEFPQQNISRYHISTFGFDLVKIMPPTPKMVAIYDKGVPVYQKPNGELLHVTTEKEADEVAARAAKGKPYRFVETLHVAPDRRFEQHKEWKVTVCNHMKDASLENIEYEWYIMEAEKLVKPLLKGE